MLNESTIRRFMKLATIGGLSDRFVEGNLQESNEETVEEATEEELEEAWGEKEDEESKTHPGEEDYTTKKDDDLKHSGKGRGEKKGDKAYKNEDLADAAADLEADAEEHELDAADDLAAADAEETAAAEDEATAAAMVSIDQLMSALEAALEDVLGQDVEVSQDDELEADAALDMGADLEADADLGMDIAADEEEEELALEGENTNTEVVEEVYARVIQRLTQETKSNKK